MRVNIHWPRIGFNYNCIFVMLNARRRSVLVEDVYKGVIETCHGIYAG